MSTFRLTQQALLRGLAAGVHIEEVLAFLAGQSGHKELPQNIVYTLRDWVKTYREARLSEVILVETSHDLSEEDLVRMLSQLLPPDNGARFINHYSSKARDRQQNPVGKLSNTLQTTLPPLMQREIL